MNLSPNLFLHYRPPFHSIIPSRTNKFLSIVISEINVPTATLVLFRVKNKQTRATSDDVIMDFYCHFLNKFRRAVTTFSYAFGQVFACCFGFFSYFLTNFDQILTGWKNSFSPRKLQPNMDFLRNNKTLLKTDVKLKDSFFYCIFRMTFKQQVKLDLPVYHWCTTTSNHGPDSPVFVENC